MKFRINPDKVYLVVFMFFLTGAGCKAAGEFVYERLAEPEQTMAVDNPVLG